MAPQGGRDTASVKETLFNRTARYEFFQAVRLLEGILSERALVGRDNDPADEIVRFRSSLSLAFPGADVEELRTADDDGPPELTVAFMGAATPGSWGSLPRRYTEEIRKLVRDKNTALRDFIDLFNHRFISLFYRAWRKHRLPIQYERGADGHFEQVLRGVIGLATGNLVEGLSLDRRMLLARSGLIAMKPMPASALESLLRSVFGVEVRIEPFVPDWYGIEEDDRNAIGQRSSRLGEDIYIGSEVRLIQSKFRIHVGPIDFEGFQDFLPEGEGARTLFELVRLATGDDLDFEVRLSLAAPEVPSLYLGEGPGPECRLGWSSWLAREGIEEDAEDAFFVPRTELAPGGPAWGAGEHLSSMGVSP